MAFAIAASLIFATFGGAASARSVSKREAASFAAAKKRLSKKQKAKIRRQLLKQVKKNPRAVKSRSFLRKAALVNFVLPVTIRLRTPCPAGTNGAAYCPAGTGNTALNQRTLALANADLGASLGQRQISLGGALPAEVQFRDSYDGGALGNVMVKLLPSNAASKQIQTSSVPVLWNPDVGDTTEDTYGTISRYDKGLMDAVRNDYPPAGAFALTRTQGCGDFAADPAGVAPGGHNHAFSQAQDHNPFPHNTRMTSAILTDALTPYPGPAGAGSPGYNALFGDVPYDFIGAGVTGSGIPGFPYYGPSAVALLTTGSGLLPPSISLGDVTGAAPHLPTAFLPVFYGPDRIDNLRTGYEVGDNEVLGPDQTPFPYPAIAPGDFTQPPDVKSTILRTNALSLGIASAGTQVDVATGTGAPPGSSPPGFPTGEGSQNVIIGQSGGEANLFGNIPGKDSSIDVTVSLKTTIYSIFRVQDQDLWELPLEEDDEYPAGLFNCRQIWSGGVDNYIPGIRLKGNLRISPAITKDGKLRIAKASVTTQQPAAVALTACLMPYSAYVENNDNIASSGYSTDAAAAHVPTAAETIASFPPLQGFLLMPWNSDALPAYLNQRRYSAGGEISVRGPNPGNVVCNTTPTDIVYRSGLYGLVTPQTAPSQANGYTTSSDGSTATVRGDITTSLEVDVLIGDA